MEAGRPAQPPFPPNSVIKTSGHSGNAKKSLVAKMCFAILTKWTIVKLSRCAKGKGIAATRENVASVKTWEIDGNAARLSPRSAARARHFQKSGHKLGRQNMIFIIFHASSPHERPPRKSLVFNMDIFCQL